MCLRVYLSTDFEVKSGTVQSFFYGFPGFEEFFSYAFHDFCKSKFLSTLCRKTLRKKGKYLYDTPINWCGNQILPQNTGPKYKFLWSMREFGLIWDIKNRREFVYFCIILLFHLGIYLSTVIEYILNWTFKFWKKKIGSGYKIHDCLMS